MSGQLHVESIGHGAPLVLLHGWAMHSGVWGPLIPRLAKYRRVHAVDLPGHGHSVPTLLFTVDGAVTLLAKHYEACTEPLAPSTGIDRDTCPVDACQT